MPPRSNHAHPLNPLPRLRQPRVLARETEGVRLQERACHAARVVHERTWDAAAKRGAAMKAQYAYAVYMPTVGLLTKTVAASEKETIELFAQFEPRLTWLEALKAGFKMKKCVLVVLE